ncbi:SH3 domain-containing protein [Oxalobacteraceae bacterium A2-2]
MDLHDLRSPAAYAAGLALTLFLCAYLTPRSWWRRLTARALLISGAGAWCFGSLLQALGPAGAQAAAAPLSTAASGAFPPGGDGRALPAPSTALPCPPSPDRHAAGAPAASAHGLEADPGAQASPRPCPGHAGCTGPAPCAASASYTVHRDLNLRAGPGVHADRLATIPAGAAITATGPRQGDWWQIRTTVDGRELSGWSSSLWLRRSGE